MTSPSREAFEAHMRETYGAHVNLARSSGGYVSTVPHAGIRITYASVQMLWKGWQAATNHTCELAVKACEERWRQRGLLSANACADAIKEALK